MSQFESVCEQVSKRISPNLDERKRIGSLAERLRQRVNDTCSSLGLEAEVRIDGSVAKDTWLSQEADVDIFMRVAPHLSREDFERRCLEVARSVTKGYNPIERFAEHPYLEAWVEGVRINIVPCYNVEKGKWQSATDRTPYHTEYMKRHLDDGLRREIRLLKKLTKATGIYGAEIKTSGFSGFLCEILTVHSNSFKNLLESAATWKRRQVIDVDKIYSGRETEVYDLFDEPLIVIDPVDPARNVAAAVAERRLWEFVALSRAFIQNPCIEFFYPPKRRATTSRNIQSRIVKTGSSFIFLTFGTVDAVVDILWSQLYKTEKSLRTALEGKSFTVYRSGAWSNEKNLNVLVFELERDRIPKTRRHLGPQVERREESQRFLAKHVGAPDTVAGPWIENERWKVHKTRDYVDAVIFLNDHLRAGGKGIGVGSRITQTLKTGYRLFRETEIHRLTNRDADFARFLSEFLIGMPTWLRWAQNVQTGRRR
jgi:tRNA nucleotidyltransferase (CCA-adding enzyme)